jgi:hypothetical protein
MSPDEIAELRHDIGNALSIAQANIEAIIDGVFDPTPDRLGTIRDSLAAAGDRLKDLR